MNILDPAPTPFDLNFRLFGIVVRVSGWFWILPGALGILCARFLGFGYLFILAGCFFLSILIHEFGHAFAGRYFGKESSIVLNGIGGAAIGAADLVNRWHRIIVFLAGPLAQLFFAGVLWLTSDQVMRSLFPGAPYDHPVRFILIILKGMNFTWPLFNLLPIKPMDGWHIGRDLLGVFRGQDRPPWEQDADWWKRGSWNFEGPSSGRIQGHAARSRQRIITVAVIAGILMIGWVAVRLDKSRRREQAYTALENHGVAIGSDGPAKVFGFNFQHTNFRDEQLALVEDFDEVEDMDLAGTHVSDAGLRHLRGLRAVKTLDLRYNPISGEGLSQLDQMTELETLYLCGTQVTDAGLEHLPPLPKLQWLYLSRTRVTDSGLPQIRKCPQLKLLDVSDCNVSEQGIAELKKAMPILVINSTHGDEGCSPP